MRQLYLIICVSVCFLMVGCSSNAPAEPSWTAEELLATMQSHHDGELGILHGEILPATNVFDAQDEFRVGISDKDSIEVYQFERADQARTVTGYVSADGQQLSNAPKWAQALGVSGPWDGAMNISANPILYFRYRNFILSYSGSDGAIVDMLRAVAGEPFAGN